MEHYKHYEHFTPFKKNIASITKSCKKLAKKKLTKICKTNIKILTECHASKEKDKTTNEATKMTVKYIRK